jgi:putative transposase
LTLSPSRAREDPMARKLLIRTNQYPYHVTSRSNNRAWFDLPMADTWEIALSCLCYANQKFPIHLHAFVLMSNHYHMLLTTPDANIDHFMQAFNKRFSEHLREKTSYINRMFGGPYKWSIINNRSYLYNVHRYIYQNPLSSGLVDKCEQYPYSTLIFELNRADFPLKLVSNLDHEITDILPWFNKHIDNRDADGIRRGFKHAIFQLKKHRDTKYLAKLSMPLD